MGAGVSKKNVKDQISHGIRDNVKKAVKYKTFAVKEDIFVACLDCSVMSGRTLVPFSFSEEKRCTLRSFFGSCVVIKWKIHFYWITKL